MTQRKTNIETSFLGDLPPLLAGGRRRPDKRQVSLRWLSGSVLTGLTSAFLMGGALLAALDGRQQLTLPAQAYENPEGADRPSDSVVKGARPGLTINVETSDSNVMMVSTVTREDNRDVVKVKPFLHIRTSLAAAPADEFDYPAFNPLAVFSDTGRTETASQSSDQIYGADVESEVTITMMPFDPNGARVAVSPKQRESDIEEMVRLAAPGLGMGATSVASLSYFDPGRFSFLGSGLDDASGVTITAENVSVVEKQNRSDLFGRRFEERVVKVRAQAPIAEILTAEGVDEAEADLLDKVLSADIGSREMQPEDRIRLAYEIRAGTREISVIHPSRISLYRAGAHLVSIARTDSNRFVYATEPEPIPQVTPSDSSRPIPAGGRLPSAYDAIYRNALSEGLSDALAAKLVRIFAFDVDFNARISPIDELSVFLSLEDGSARPTESSEILFASIRLGNVTRKYYRFRDAGNGRIDYYDENGKSAKKFLLRQPVPNGRFRSPFGPRWHPISKVRKMHWGVDWAAPRGTPILAAGSGTVVSAGWESGYGRHTEVRHANGYVTSYSHQSKIGNGIAPGARVRQGQVIGYVGSTGLSTGPHLHYEVIVNGTKVDPMRIRLPQGKVLEGEELVAFENERDRIDDLLSDDGEDTRLARY